MNCTTVQCERPTLSKGLCEYHYRKQWMKSRPKIACIIKDCLRTARSRGLCETHYGTAYRYGELGKYPKKPSAINPDAPSKKSEYYIFKGMKARCNNKQASGYDNYGGRGIRVCPEWSGTDGFTKFYKYMGKRPSMSHSIDRIDGNGNYEPGNVRWATPHQQAANMRSNVEYVGVTYDAKHDKWRAKLDLNGKTILIKLYKTKAEAIAVREYAVEIYLGKQ